MGIIKQLHLSQSATSSGTPYIHAVEQQPVPQQLSAKKHTGTQKKLLDKHYWPSAAL